MKLLRPLKSVLFRSVLSCLLAVLMVGGSAVPSPALWQCRYSSRVVSAAFTTTVTPSAMPCLMGRSPRSGTMPAMPCCHSAKAAAHSSPHGKQAVSPPACRPALTSLAAVSALGKTEAGSSLRQSLAAMQAVLPATAAFRASAPRTLSGRQRPPPTVSSPPAAPAYSFGLRAPPAA